VVDPRSRDGLSTFRLVVTFKPDAFKVSEDEAAEPAAAPVAPAVPAKAEPQPEVQT